MAKALQETKTLNIRMPRETWVFLRQISTDTDMSINAILMRLVNGYKTRKEKKLEKKTEIVVDDDLML